VIFLGAKITRLPGSYEAKVGKILFVRKERKNMEKHMRFIFPISVIIRQKQFFDQTAWS